MAEFETTITLTTRRSKVLHRSLAKRFSIEILSLDGVPVGSLPIDPPVFLHKVVGGAIPTPAEASNFLSMPASQCIPFGTIRGQLRQGVGASNGDAVIGYKVRTGSNA
jgi:hypothetical protein